MDQKKKKGELIRLKLPTTNNFYFIGNYYEILLFVNNTINMSNI